MVARIFILAARQEFHIPTVFLNKINSLVVKIKYYLFLSRIEARKLLLVCVRQCCPEVFSGDDKYWRDIADFVGVQLGKPLVAAHEYYAPYR